MKRFTIILLTILLAVAMLAVPASAAEESVIVTPSVSGKPGETVTLTVSLDGFENVSAVGVVFSGLSADSTKSAWLIPSEDGELVIPSITPKDATYGSNIKKNLSGPVLNLAFPIPSENYDSSYTVQFSLAVKHGNGKQYDCSRTAVINVVNPATGITIENSQIRLDLSDPDNRTAIVVPVVTPGNHTDTLTWTSSDSAVATVSDGVITAIGKGTATITVKANDNVKKNCLVTVFCSHVNAVWIKETEATCTAPGNNAYFACSDCDTLLKDDGETVTTLEEETLPQLPHSYSDTWSTDEHQHFYLCTTCSIAKDQAADHSFVWVVDDPVEGIQHEECTDCKLKRNENTPIPETQNIHVCAQINPDTYTIGTADKPEVTLVVTKNGTLMEAGSEEYEALGLGFNIDNTENSLEAALEKAGTYTITPYCTNAPANSTVTYQSAELKVVVAGYQDAYCKTTYQIKLIEPWALRINVRITDEASNTIDYSKVKDFGVYAIRRDLLADSKADVADMTIEDLMAEANVIHFNREDGTAEQSGQYVAITFSGGMYTYRLNQDVIWALYYETDEGVFATEVKERNLYDLMNERKDSTSATYSAEEKNVYADMVELFDRITDYRSDFTNLNDMVLQNTDTLATTDIAFASASTDGKYNFARVQQIGLIEPWGIRLNTRIYTPDNTNGAIDYNTLKDYGVIVYHDKANAVNPENLNEAAEFLNFADKAKTYVFSGSQGTSTISGNYATSTFNDSIYTYELDSTLYYMFFAQDGDNFYYSQVYATNIRTLAADRSVSTSTTYSEKEKRTYAAMVELCDSIADYREWYFAKLGE